MGVRCPRLDDHQKDTYIATRKGERRKIPASCPREKERNRYREVKGVGWCQEERDVRDSRCQPARGARQGFCTSSDNPGKRGKRVILSKNSFLFNEEKGGEHNPLWRG